MPEYEEPSVMDESKGFSDISRKRLKNRLMYF
jgi:hypothetical protein